MFVNSILSIEYHPTDEQLVTIGKLVKKEYDARKRDGYGWWDNWCSAVEYHKKYGDQIYILLLDGKPIGFRSHVLYSSYVELNIFWIDVPYRRHGLGMRYWDMLTKRYAELGLAVARAEPVTPDGYAFVRKAGFQPQLFDKFDTDYHYLVLPPYSLAKEYSELSDNYLVFYKKYGADNTKHYISLEQNFELQPCVCRIHYDDIVEVHLNGQVIGVPEKIKYYACDYGILNYKDSKYLLLDKNLENTKNTQHHNRFNP